MRLLWNERYTVSPPILLYLGHLGWFKTLGARASNLRYYLMPCFGCAEAKIFSLLVSQQDHSISIRQTTDWVWRWNPRGRGRGARAGGRRFEHRSLPPEDVQESLATKAIRACRGMDQTYLVILAETPCNGSNFGWSSPLVAGQWSFFPSKFKGRAPWKSWKTICFHISMDAHVFLVQKHVVSSLEAKLARIGTAAEIMVPREWALWVLPKEMCRWWWNQSPKLPRHGSLAPEIQVLMLDPVDLDEIWWSCYFSMSRQPQPVQEVPGRFVKVWGCRSWLCRVGVQSLVGCSSHSSGWPWLLPILPSANLGRGSIGQRFVPRISLKVSKETTFGVPTVNW